MCSHKTLYTNGYSSIIHNGQKVPGTQPRDDWITKYGGSIRWNVECQPAIKRNEILTHATTWMNLENIMLSQRSQT